MNNSSQVDVSKRDVIMNENVSLEKNGLNKSKTKWSQRGDDYDEEDGAAVNDEDDDEEENENEEHKSKKSTTSSSSSRQMTTTSPRNHSRSRSSSSLANVVKQQQQQQRKCASCIIWQNIYQVFEFLTNGRLLVDEQDYNEMYIGNR